MRRKQQIYLLRIISLLLVFSWFNSYIFPRLMTQSTAALRKNSQTLNHTQRVLVILAAKIPSPIKMQLIAKPNGFWKHVFNSTLVESNGKISAILRGAKKEFNDHTDIYSIDRNKDGSWPDLNNMKDIKPIIDADHEIYWPRYLRQHEEDVVSEKFRRPFKPATSIEDPRTLWGNLKDIDGELRFFPDTEKGNTLGIFIVVHRDFISAPLSSDNPDHGIAQIAFSTIGREDYDAKRWDKLKRHGLLWTFTDYADKDVNIFPDTVKLKRKDENGNDITEEVWAFVHRPMYKDEFKHIVVSFAPKDQGIGRGTFIGEPQILIKADEKISEDIDEKFRAVGVAGIKKIRIGERELFFVQYHGVLSYRENKKKARIYVEKAQIRDPDNIFAKPLWEGFVFSPVSKDYLSKKIANDNSDISPLEAIPVNANEEYFYKETPAGPLYHGMSAGFVTEGGEDVLNRDSVLIYGYGGADNVTVELSYNLVKRDGKSGIIPEEDWDRLEKLQRFAQTPSKSYRAVSSSI